MKKNILIIAPEVPRPDKNSGALRFFSLLELLCDLSDIVFIALTAEAGDHVYVETLHKLGIKVRDIDEFKEVVKSKQFDAAILEFYFVAEYYLPRLRFLQPNCLIITDSVDVHFLRLKMKADLFDDPAAMLIYERTRQIELSVYQRSDIVLTVTDDDKLALAEEGITSTLRIIPNVHALSPGRISTNRETLVFVGGFSHDPNVDAMMYFVKEVLPRIASVVRNIKLVIVGNKPPQEILALQSENVAVTGYVPSTTPYLHASYISVAPLRYGAGMKGKIGEAMAHGIPVVTTSVGAQGMNLTALDNIMIADTPEHFASAVVQLLGDDALYAKIRKNGLQHVDDKYTKARLRPSIASIFSEKHPVNKFTLLDRMYFTGRYFADRCRKLCNRP